MRIDDTLELFFVSFGESHLVVQNDTVDAAMSSIAVNDGARLPAPGPDAQPPDIARYHSVNMIPDTRLRLDSTDGVLLSR